MTKDKEQTLADVVIEQRALIASGIGQLRDWLTLQSNADIKNPSLSANQRAMARRVFNRAMHTGLEADQASDAELDSYFVEANILREIVPPELARVQQGIEDAARLIRTVFLFADMADQNTANDPDEGRAAVPNASRLSPSL